jgi:hypothetical protein
MNARFVLMPWLVSLALSSEAAAQTGKDADGKKPPDVPTISARSFVEGTATVKVTGAFQIDAEIAINAKASFGDGEMTWIQFGVSGAKEPNALLTYSQEIGIIIGGGSSTVTAEGENCSGAATVTGSLVTGHYRCTGITAYDKATKKMGKVDITIRFTARS